MTNKYMYFIANWKMYGNTNSLNTLNKVIKFSKSKEINKGRIILQSIQQQDTINSNYDESHSKTL